MDSSQVGADKEDGRETCRRVAGDEETDYKGSEWSGYEIAMARSLKATSLSFPWITSSTEPTRRWHNTI